MEILGTLFGSMLSYPIKLRNQAADSLFSVVTLGAVVDIPTDTFGLNTYQFLGQFDALGQINSERDPPFIGKIAIEHEVIPGVGHHLNPRIPCYLSVEEVLRRVKLPPDGDGSRREVGGDERSMTPSWGDWSSIIARGRATVPRTNGSWSRDVSPP